MLLLISFTTNYGDDNLLQISALPVHDKVGVGLHFAALAALVAMFNWRPVYDIEQQTKQHELSELESEKRLRQLKIETEQLRQENKRLAGLNSRMDALLRNADSSSQLPPATDSN